MKVTFCIGDPELHRWHHCAEVHGIPIVVAILLHLCGSPWHGHTRWSYELVPGIEQGTRTTRSSKKVITCEIVPLSLLLNTALGGSSQQSLVQEAASSTPVSSQNVLTNRETFTSCTFPFGHCHCQLCTASLTLCKTWEYTSNHSELSTSPAPRPVS